MSQESLNNNQTQDFKCSHKVPKSLMMASRSELTDIPMDICGDLPKDLYGHVFLVTSVGSVESGGLPYANGDSILCGDGMIYRLDFNSDDDVKITTRIARPPDYYADEATRQGSKYDKYRFQNHGITRFSFPLGIRNQLNTAFLPMKFADDTQERLLVTYDAGRPYEIDTKTLEAVTPIGTNQEWEAEIRGYNAPFPPFLSTAHPAFDRHTKQMFTVNYGRSLINILDTIPLIYNLEQLPQEVNELLDEIGLSLQIHFLKDIFHLFSKPVLTFVQLYIKFIEKLLNFNLEIDNFVYVICWDGAGDLQRWKLVLPDKSPVAIDQTIHQIGITKDYVVIMDTAFTTGLEQIVTNPFPQDKKVETVLRNVLERPTAPYSLVYIVPRADLKAGQFPLCDREEVEVVVQKVVLPLEAAHFLLNYENPDSKITLHTSHICGMDVSEWVRQFDISAYDLKLVSSSLCGMQPSQTDIGRMGRYLINGETGDIIESNIISDGECTWGVDLYTYPDQNPQTGEPLAQLEDIYWCSFGLWKDLMTQFIVNQYKHYKNRLVPLEKLFSMASQGIPASLFRLHSSSTEPPAIADRYKLQPGYVLLSPQFAPRRGAKTPNDGYIVCTVWHEDKNEFWVFDAQDLSKGSLCKLSHPSLKFALTLHTAWLPKIGTRQASYHINVREDFKELVDRASRTNPDIKDLFEQEIYPHFQ